MPFACCGPIQLNALLIRGKQEDMLWPKRSTCWLNPSGMTFRPYMAVPVGRLARLAFFWRAFRALQASFRDIVSGCGYLQAK
jgi:hypothetical protein